MRGSDRGNISQGGGTGGKMAKTVTFLCAVLLCTACGLGEETMRSTEAVAEETISQMEKSATEEDRFVFSDREILFKDCVCEYEKDGGLVYSYFVEDKDSPDSDGYYILYIRTPSDALPMTVSAESFLINSDAHCLYMIWSSDGVFTRVESVGLADGGGSFVMQTIYSMEILIADAYGLETSDLGDGDFADLCVELTGLYEENGRTFLQGRATGIYKSTGKSYSIEWEVDTDTGADSARAYLSDWEIHPLYAEFLRGERKVTTIMLQDIASDSLGFFDDREVYEEVYYKSFALVDVNHDDVLELIFQMHNSPSELMYLLGIQGDELVCYDIFETHTVHMGAWIYVNGIVGWAQDYDGNEEIYYTYANDGSVLELIHFRKEWNSPDSEKYYDYYYENGDEGYKHNIQNNEEYESLDASFRGIEPKWFKCADFADIPQDIPQ